MNDKIRVLCIAPYPGMKNAMQNLLEEYPQIDLTLFVGDLDRGVEIAKESFHRNYDVIISRGGTAKMLRQQFSIPVVEIVFSAYDILCTLKLASERPCKAAMVSFSPPNSEASMLCNLFGYTLDMFTIENRIQVKNKLSEIRSKDYAVILCDQISDMTAKNLGMNSFLINSGIDSLRQALDQVLILNQHEQHIKGENLFFRELLFHQRDCMAVFDKNSHLLLSVPEGIDNDRLNMLKQEIPRAISSDTYHTIHDLNGQIYSIYSNHLHSSRNDAIVFHYSTYQMPILLSKIGVAYYSDSEMERFLYDSLLNLSNISDLQSQAGPLSRSRLPVLLYGENGTRKFHAADYLYLHSSLRNCPFVSIDCRLLGQKELDLLIENAGSPLYGKDSTLYFSHIDTLPEKCQKQFLYVLKESSVCQLNRIIFSCLASADNQLSPCGKYFADELCCYMINLPPLRQCKSQIPSLINLSLNFLNAKFQRQIVGMTPDAIQRMQKFSWPQNYPQLERVLNELVLLSQGAIITLNDVEAALKKESGSACFSSKIEQPPLDLNRPLSEIQQDIALRIVAEFNGNQTAAAKSLGISRTTLWRLLKK